MTARVGAGVRAIGVPDEGAKGILPGVSTDVPLRLTDDSVFYGNVNVEYTPGQWHEFTFVQKPLQFYEDLGNRYGLRMDVVGQLKDVGYPLQDATQFNYMLAFRRQ